MKRLPTMGGRIIYLFLLCFASQAFSCASVFSQLLAAQGEADARFITQRKYGFREDPKFTQPMGEIIQSVSNEIAMELLLGNEIKPQDISLWLDAIASTRHWLAWTHQSPAAEDYGRKTPSSKEELLRRLNTKMNDKPMYTAEEIQARIFDTYEDHITEKNRHQAYFHRALIESRRRMKRIFRTNSNVHYFANMERQRHHFFRLMNYETGHLLLPSLRDVMSDSAFEQLLEYRQHIKLEEQRIPLSFIDVITIPDSQMIMRVTITHPTLVGMAKLRKESYRIMSRALSDPDMGESEFLDEMAHAFFLSVHGPPYMRGNAAILEGFMDAMIRAKFGKTFPPLKVKEPFFEAILWDLNDGNFSGEELLNCYQFHNLEIIQ